MSRYHYPKLKAIKLCGLGNLVENLTGEPALCRAARQARGAECPDCREEIMQTATEIPLTLGSHSWRKRKGFKMPQEPQVISFVRNFAFSDHREKALRSVGSEEAREKGKLCTEQGCKSWGLIIVNLAFYIRM